MLEAIDPGWLRVSPEQVQMMVNTSTVRDRVLSLFESTRKTKGAPYEPGRFQIFLTDPPRDPNSPWHRGRFVRFMYSVEQEFGFCFTREEWDRRFSLDEFVSRIEEKLTNRQDARQYACRRLAQVRRLGLNQLFLQILFSTGVFAVAVISIRITAVRFLVVAVWAGVLATFACSWLKDYAHLKRIVNRTHDALG